MTCPLGPRCSGTNTCKYEVNDTDLSSTLQEFSSRDRINHQARKESMQSKFGFPPPPQSNFSDQPLDSALEKDKFVDALG